MSRLMPRSWILGVCALTAGTLCLADQPAPAPQRAEGRKAPASNHSPPPTMTPVAGVHTVAPAAPQTGSTNGIVFVGGKSSINSQPVPPGKTGPTPQLIGPGPVSINSQPVPPGSSAMNSQPVPPGKPLVPVGPGPGDPAARKVAKPAQVH